MRARARVDADGFDADDSADAAGRCRGDPDERHHLLRREPGDRRAPLVRVARLDAHLGEQRALPLDDAARDVLGEILDEERLVLDDALDRLLEQLGEARHVHALLRGIEVDGAVDRRRDELLAPASSDPHRLLHPGDAGAREADGHLGGGGLQVLEPLHTARLVPALQNDTSFARLVSLACHDVRTPLATVHGFTTTLARTTELQPPADRYVEMIDAASKQIAELLDELSLVARIESGRYDPMLREADTLALAHAAAERLGDDRVHVSGEGAAVETDLDAVDRGVSALVQATLRHGGLDEVDVVVRGKEIDVSGVTDSSAPVVVGQDLRDLGAAVAVRVIEVLGGAVSVSGQTLTIRLA